MMALHQMNNKLIFDEFLQQLCIFNSTKYLILSTYKDKKNFDLHFPQL